MATLVGLGIAASLWEEFLDDELDDLAAQAQDEGTVKPAQRRLENWPDDVRQEVATQVREESELLGFWLAWHLAGGFRQLELSGWHRATIFRKIRQFRDSNGAHPDETDFPWLTIGLSTYWREKVLDNFRTPTATDPPGDLQSPCRPPSDALPRPLTELASGVDALYLSGRGQLRPEVLDALEDIRALAVKVNQPLPTIIDDVCLTIWPHGWGECRYCLYKPNARIGLTASSNLPPMRIHQRLTRSEAS